MDFTYYFAVIFGIIAMIISHLIRRLAKAPISRKWSAVTLVAAILFSFEMSLNWSHLFDWGLGFAVFDLSMIALATVIGCLVAGPYTVISIFKR